MGSANVLCRNIYHSRLLAGYASVRYYEPMNNRYVVLLRGVNVGGANRVPKEDFKTILESIGCTNATIYINSGNAVCTSDDKLDAAKVRAALESHFKFSIPTLVLPAKTIQAIASAIPSDWTNDAPSPDRDGQKSDVLYLFDGINSPDIIQKMGHRPEFEQMIYVDGAVLTNVSRKLQTKSSLMRLAGTELYGQMTIRNINTAKKLAELL